jgi:hypothetical protein
VRRILAPTPRIGGRVLLAACLLLAASAGLARPVCEGTVTGSGNNAIGFIGECLPDDQCPPDALDAAMEWCPWSYYWAAYEALHVYCEDGLCDSGECTVDPTSFPVYSADDCEYTCTEFPPPSFPACGARYTYDHYECTCANEITVPYGACIVIFSLCIETTAEICGQSGFLYRGDGSRCIEPPAGVPATTSWGLVLLGLSLVTAGSLARRRR